MKNWILTVVEHTDGPVDRMPKNTEQPPLRRLSEQIVRLEDERADHDLRQLRVGEAQLLRSLNPRHGRRVNVHEGGAVGVSHAGNGGVDYGDLGVLRVAVGDAELGRLDEAVAASHGVLDG